MASAVADQWPQEGGAQTLEPCGESHGSPQGFRGALSGAQCSPDTRERVMWLLLELLSHQALAAEMQFLEVGRTKQDEERTVSEELGKAAGLCLEQAWAQGKAVISAGGSRKGKNDQGDRPELSKANQLDSLL